MNASRLNSLKWGLSGALLLGSAVGCGAANASGANDASSAPKADAATTAQPSAKEDSGNADVHPALRPLLPAGSKPVLQAMEAAPDDAAAVAAAAEFYSKTDTAGMTLLWGTMYGAMAPSGPQADQIATAISRVLRDRVSVTIEGEKRDISTRLAPGATPGLAQPDGSIKVPTAYIFEQLFGAAIAIAFKGSPGLAEDQGAFTAYVSIISSQPTPLDSYVELNGWLVQLGKAGHAEAFFGQLIGPAFPEQFAAWSAKNEDALTAAREYVTQNPLRPTHAVLPDGLVTIAQ